MNDNNGGFSCALGCWALAAGAGLLAFILLIVLGGQGFIASVFLSAVLFAGLGLLMGWIFCQPLPKAGEVKPGEDRGMRAVPPPLGETGHAAPAAAPAPKAEAPAAAAKPAATAPAAAEPVIQPSKALAGEADLAGRKGSWKYQGAAAPASAAAPAPAAAEAGEGTRPAMLSAAREGGPDNLKDIKGIGPKLEQLCHSMGVFHFDQIASWGPAEVAWMDANLEGFKGRVTRDDWVGQAKALVAGR
ncbi:endonuclease [Thetidibacter halocola]|uniref:Endonuclease n=1 Tax=Thetidibacter halocola TaxID=2827239 RepID=A0A8J7WFV3_9RHOB|nr:endonuclease [Thetidibacter halocola]MBS0124288.1 endonuclease [Thetidibacter halocola]